MKQHSRPHPWRGFALLAAAALPLAALAAGCKHGSSADNSPSAVRIVDAVQAGGSDLVARVSLGDTTAPLKTIDLLNTDFIGVQPGSYSVQVGTQSSQQEFSPLTDLAVNVQTGRRYTAIAYGNAGVASSPSPVRLQIFSAPKEDKEARDRAAQSGKAMVAVFNASPGSGKLDLLVNSIVAFKNVGYGKRSAFLPLASVPYEWGAVPAGGGPSDALGQSTTLQLNPGRVYLVIVMGSAASGDLRLEAFEQ